MNTNLDKANFHEAIAVYCSELKLWPDAAKHWQEAGLYLKDQTPDLAAKQFRCSADAYFAGGSFSEAVKVYLLAMDHSERIFQAGCCLEAARCYAKMDLLSEAFHYFSKAAELYAPIDASLAIESLKQAIACDPGDVALIGLYGQILMLSDQNNGYTEHLKQHLLRCEQLTAGDPQSIVWAAKGLAKVKESLLAASAYRLASKWETSRQQASAYLKEAIDQCNLMNDGASQIELSKELASLYLGLGQDIQAASVFTTIGELCEKIPNYVQAANFFMQAANIFKTPSQAARCYQKAARNFAANEDYHQAGDCYREASQLYLLIDQDLAAACYKSAVEEFKKTGDAIKKGLCCMEAAREFSQKGRGKDAVSFYKEVSSDLSDQNTSILYFEQAASSCKETELEFAASCLEAIACKLAIKEDHATAEKYRLAADANRRCSLFEKAAADYHQAKDFYLKVNKNEKLAAECCRNAAECLSSLDQNVESRRASESYQEAGRLYSSIDVPAAIHCFECAIQYDRSQRTSIITCLEKMHKQSQQWEKFLIQAAEWFEVRNEFVKAMGIYGMVLTWHHETLLFEEKNKIRKQIESCLKQCEKLTKGLVEAAVWAARAFVVKNFANQSSAAKFYRLAGIWEQDREKAAKYLKKVVDLYEIQGLLPSHLEEYKRLAELYKMLGKFYEAGALFEKMGKIYKHNFKMYEEAASSFTESGKCYKGSENVAQAVSCSNQAAKCWVLSRRLDQVGNCLEQAGEWQSLISREEAIPYFLKASTIFQQCGREKRAQQCINRAATQDTCKVA